MFHLDKEKKKECQNVIKQSSYAHINGTWFKLTSTHTYNMLMYFIDRCNKVHDLLKKC